jgi:anion-transporting  ArsA/GET3 family ATPase
MSDNYHFSIATESKLLKARMKMQQKYIDQFYMLYEDFNITKLPLLPQEVPFFIHFTSSFLPKIFFRTQVDFDVS